MERTVTAAPPTSEPGVDSGHGTGTHPGPRQYIGVAAILAVLTAVEVGLYYTDLAGLALVSILLGLAAVKFGMVAAYFMHLKFDGRLLRRLFGTGIVLAGGVYTVALFTLGVLVG
ncbi:MAG: cytochrome C oxidase subunit IV family protein [Acidimicrobiia bacterium]